MKKSIIIIILIIALMLTMFPGISLASFAEGDRVTPGQPVNIAFHNTYLEYLTLNGTVRGFRYTYFWFLTKDNVREEHPVYCLNPNARGAYELVRDDGATGDGPNTAKYLSGEKVSQNEYVQIMIAGYPHNMVVSLGLQDENEAYYATKIALWMVILGITPASGKVGINSLYPDQVAAKRVCNAAISIYTHAMGGLWAGITEATIDIKPPVLSDAWKLSSDNQWYEMSTYIRTNKWIGNDTVTCDDVQLSWDTSTAELPSGLVVLNENDDITGIMKPLGKNAKYEGDWRVQRITIRVPSQAVDEYFLNNEDAMVFPMPVLKALGKNMSGTNFYIATYSGVGGQPYLVEADRKIDVSTVFKTVIPRTPYLSDKPDDTGLQIIKRQSGSLTPLAGAVFEIFNPRGAFIGSYMTDSSGEIFVRLMEAGLYTVTEVTPPQYHCLPVNPTRKVQVNIGEIAIVELLNDPFGTLRIDKRDGANGRPLGGAVVQVTNISTGATISAVTGISGTASYDNLPVGNYELRELIAPAGYELDSGIYTVTVDSQARGTTQFTLVNYANPGLRIVKLDGARYIPIENVVFEIYRDGLLLGEYKTDSAGEILLTDMPAGTYIARETATVEPYILDRTTQFIELKAGQGYISELIFINNMKPGMLIKKLDADTLKPLSGAMFRVSMLGGSYSQEHITDVNGEIDLSTLDPGAYTVQETKAPGGYITDGSVRTVQLSVGENAVFVFTNTIKPSLELVKFDPSSKKFLSGAVFRVSKTGDSIHYTDCITDANGRILLTGLDPGMYSLVELAAPSGYVQDERVFSVELLPGRNAQIVFENKVKPSLLIYKYDRDTGRPLPGAKITITRVAGSIVWEGLTGSDGYIRLDGMTPGIYIVKETSAPSGYCNNGHEYIIALTSGETAQLALENVRKPSLIIHKYDEHTAQPLPSAEFSVATKNGAVIYEGITGSDGSIRLENLDPGWVTVTEMAPPPGYLNSTPNSRDIWLEPGKTAQIKFDNQRTPTLKIVKTDSVTGDMLSGVKFRVQYSPSVNYTGGVTDLGTFMTGADGSVMLDSNLQCGWYRCTELEPKQGYALKEPVTQDIYLAGGENKALYFENTPLSALVIRKTDSATGQPVSGATFEVKYLAGTSGSGGTLIKTAVTSINGTIVLTGLKAGTYVCEETVPAPGYQLSNPSVRTAYLSGLDQDVLELVFTNQRMGHLVISKLDSATKEPVAGVTFSVTDSSGAVIGPANGEYTTGVSGVIEITEWLPIGSTIIVKEIRCPDTHNMDAAPQSIKIKENTVHMLTFYDSPKSGLQIIKTDAATHAALKGACFRVYKANGEVVGDYETDGNGLIIIPKLIPGWYKIVETAAPDGYQSNDRPKDVEITNNQFVRVEFENKAMSGLQITKYDSLNKTITLSGAVFQITDSSGRVTGNSNGLFTTDAKGRILLPGLVPGVYSVCEISAPAGYIRDSTPQTIEIKAGAGLYSLSFYNEPLGGLEIQKIDEETRRPIANVEYSIRKMNGERLSFSTYITDARGIIRLYGLDDGWYTVTEVKPAAGYILYPSPYNVEVKNGAATPLRLTNRKESAILLHKINSVTGVGIYGVTFLVSNANNNPLRTVTTDQNGYIYCTGLSDGKYLIREVEAARGYIPDSSVKTFYVQYGSTSVITWENTPVTGQIQITKKSADDNTINGFPKGSLLEGAVFEIYDRAGNLADTVGTGRNGHAISKQLPLGSYDVREVKAPAYYSIAPEPVRVELEYAGQIIRMEVLDKSVSTNVSIRKKGYVEVVPGQQIRYEFHDISNNSTVSLDSFYWRDTLPTDAVRLNRIITGTYSHQQSYRIVFRTNTNSEYRILADSLSTSKNYTIDVSPPALGLASNEYVTEFMFSFGCVPAGFRQTDIPYVFCDVHAALQHDYKFTNKCDAGGVWSGRWITAVDRWVTTVYRNSDTSVLPRTGY